MEQYNYQQPKLEGFDESMNISASPETPTFRDINTGEALESRIMLTIEARRRLGQIVRGEVSLGTRTKNTKELEK
jgi:hypothetical protein